MEPALFMPPVKQEEVGTVIINFPIEPIERRYSVEWAQWFEEAFTRNGMHYITFDGTTSPKPPSRGEFLDPITTGIWKLEQLAHFLAHIRRRRDFKYVLFLHDGWFPGIEILPYIRDLAGYNIKIAGWWHAGSYDETDLLGLKGCNSWAYGLEESWLSASSAVFVGTEYHASKLLQSYYSTLKQMDNLHIVGLPVAHPTNPTNLNRERRVVWPHRISQDKQPEVFERLSKEPVFKDVQFVRTLDLNLNKQEYHKLLSTSVAAVSTATHENFGIGMVEAAMEGCYPICPRGLAYKETMEDDWLYHNYSQLVFLVSKALSEPHPYKYPHTARYSPESVTDKVCEVLKGL